MSPYPLRRYWASSAPLIGCVPATARQVVSLSRISLARITVADRTVKIAICGRGIAARTAAEMTFPASDFPLTGDDDPFRVGTPR